ncbi:hypothetical protein ABT160_04585 [Streptomyces sp. NPDC001941]|uniref:hypothetical protein n=1 Tax=Streptomyces sp. NPDC001941 TaxID=3154659 RepID=UPI00331F6853
MAVVRVIQEFPDELEADLAEFFNVDLLDLWHGRLSLRRIGVLIRSLMAKPGRSTLLMAMDKRTAWTEPDYMLARISDALELSNYLFLKANLDASDAHGLELPPPITRPGETEPQPDPVHGHFSDARELNTFFGRLTTA